MAAAATTTGSTSLPLQPSEIPAQIDLLISLHLHLWPALTLAIQNGWGTSNPQISADKRAWLAGAISELFSENQLRDLEDLEDVLEQVLSDEFEVVVDDGSLEEVARRIWKGVQMVKSGEGKGVRALQQEWESKKGKQVQGQSAADGDEEGEDEEDNEDDEEDGGVDVEMEDAPAPAPAEGTPKAEPEVDEDGFTKVVSKKRR